MQTVEMYTLREILSTPAIKWNQSKLSNLLQIHRSTLRKYMHDNDNERHAVLFFNNKYYFKHATKDKSGQRTIYG